MMFIRKLIKYLAFGMGLIKTSTFVTYLKNQNFGLGRVRRLKSINEYFNIKIVHEILNNLGLLNRV